MCPAKKVREETKRLLPMPAGSSEPHPGARHAPGPIDEYEIPTKLRTLLD